MRIRKVVDLPAPFAPTKPMMYPVGSLRSIWSRVKYLYRLVTPENSTAGSIMIPPFPVARQCFSVARLSLPLSAPAAFRCARPAVNVLQTLCHRGAIPNQDRGQRLILFRVA